VINRGATWPVSISQIVRKRGLRPDGVSSGPSIKYVTPSASEIEFATGFSRVLSKGISQQVPFFPPEAE